MKNQSASRWISGLIFAGLFFAFLPSFCVAQNWKAGFERNYKGNYDSEAKELVDSGDTQFSKGNYFNALSLYNEALRTYPNDEYIWHKKGDSFRELRQYNKAIECYNIVTSINSASASAWYYKGDCFIEFEDFDNATICFDKMVSYDKRYDEILLNRASLFDDLGEYEAALKLYDKVIELFDDEAKYWNNRGVTLLNLQRYDEAIACFDRSSEIDAEYIDSINNKGVVLIELHAYEKAIDQFDIALDIQPGHQYPLQNKGASLYYLGKYEEGAIVFQEYVSRFSDQYGYILLYLCKLASGDNDTSVLSPVLEGSYQRWPFDAIKYLTSEISDDELLAVAGNDEDKLCESYCYIGFKYKSIGDEEAAIEYSRKSIDTGKTDFIEYKMAEYELSK